MDKKPQKPRRTGPRQHYVPHEDGTGPTPEELAKIIPKGLNYCYWSLGQSPKTQFQLEEKLRAKGHPDESIASIMSSLKEDGYINDLDFAQRYFQSRQNQEGRGTTSIRFELIRKGISSDIIEQVLASEEDSEVQEQTAIDLAKRRVRSMQDVDRYKQMNRLVGFLARRGYSSSVAFSAARQAVDEAQEDNDF